jgi:hypothetical protein
MGLGGAQEEKGMCFVEVAPTLDQLAKTTMKHGGLGIETPNPPSAYEKLKLNPAG